jgi:hypothetical protein
MASTPIEVPPNFHSIIRDFTRDLTTTFPEYSILWKKWSREDISAREIETLFKYCTEVFPERFFDILYQNDDIFKAESETNTKFLPAVEFRLLYHCEGVTETTRGAIWKYLQLILMTILNSVRDKSAFGDAANIFEGVNEEELQDKLNSTLEEIGDFFKNLGAEEEGEEGASGESFAKQFANMAAAGASGENPFSSGSGSGSNGGSNGGMPNMEEFKSMFERMGSMGSTGESGGQEDMPNANDLHEHLKGLFDGKIGSLAKELAEEITQDVETMFEADGSAKDVRSTGDLIQKIIKNPKKVMGLMKTISGKLQQKMKSGEISEEEIMKEAGELMGKMKGMKGMGPMNDMFKNLAKGMLGGKGASGGINMGALNNMQRKMAMKERMRAKMEEKKEQEQDQKQKHIERTADPTRAVFRLDDEEGETQQYSAAPPPSALSDAELVAMFDAKASAPSSNKKKSSGGKKSKK